MVNLDSSSYFGILYSVRSLDLFLAIQNVVCAVNLLHIVDTIYLHHDYDYESSENVNTSLPHSDGMLAYCLSTQITTIFAASFPSSKSKSKERCLFETKSKDNQAEQQE